MNLIEEISKLRQEKGLTLAEAKVELLGKEQVQAMQEELADAVRQLEEEDHAN